MRTRSHLLTCLLIASIVAVVVIPASALLAPRTVGVGGSSPSVTGSASALSISALSHAPSVPVPYTEPGREVPGATLEGPAAPTLTMPILLTFQFANGSRLATLLTELENPNSPEYHSFLTAAQVDRDFGQPSASYASAVLYLESLGATQVQTFADHVSLSFDASPAVATAIFHTPIDTYRWSGQSYYAPTSSPTLPAPLARLTAGVDGLSSFSALIDRPLHSPPTIRTGGVRETPSASPRLDAYPSPVTSGGVQYEYASDFQVAYDQLSLFADEGYPTNMVAATILTAGEYEGGPISTPWGNLNTGQAVGPFVPGDIYDFYNQTLPAGEPHAHIAGVPVDGAPWPGPLAQYDSTESNVENTLDLEMLGSTAPGASLYNVYGPTLSYVDADDAFAFILNPNATVPGLANVSVISNSWGGGDGFDPGWNASLAVATVRGVTVLASSGDSASNPNGFGGGQDPPGNLTFFPASMAYDSYGVVAVGGTTVTLDPSTLQMSSDVVWNESDLYTNGNPAGSTGGISYDFPAPSWQNDTSANAVIGGQGRGVPDIAAIANNTIMSISINGYYYNSSNASTGAAYIQVAGTSVASPLTAGMIVDADHVLAATNASWLGFLDPTLYPLANEQYTSVPLSTSGAVGFIPTGTYDSLLPTLPFYDVTVGQNFVYYALPGYDLVTGWGTIDAYNYTMYYATSVPTNTPGEFSSVRAAFNLTGLNGTSTSPYYNASIQQNFFVANGLGAPIYWVQNVVYINGTPGAWQMNFSGWVVYPFWGIYPSNSTYEYNFPLVGQVLSTPLDFTIVTTLENTSVEGGASVQFSFGILGASPVTLPLPGGSYILGGVWNNYSWQGSEFSNNPLENGAAGSLSPQFGLVGGPSGGVTDFTGSTGGNLQLTFQRFGSNQWVPGATAGFGESNDQTGETAANLDWTVVTPADLATSTPANWSLGLSAGSVQQGVLETDPYAHVQTYATTFTATGINGSLWGIALSTGQFPTSSSSQIVVALANGTYNWSVAPPDGYSASPTHGQLVVDGAPLHTSIAFTLVEYNVTLVALALPAGYSWWANVTFHTVGSHATVSYESNLSSIAFQSSNGTLVISFAGEDNWTGSPARSNLSVAGSPVRVTEAFAPPPRYLIAFVETGLPAHSNWTLRLTGNATNLTTNGSTITRSLENGSYAFRANSSLGGYFVASAQFGVDGAPRIVYVEFFPAIYAVTFNESGLPVGSLWGVQISDGPYLSTQGDNITWTAANGTYNYTILSEVTGWSPTPRSGQLLVDGGPVRVSANFGQVVYAVTFTMSGLPTGTSWGVAIDGGASTQTQGTSLTFSLVNGTYQYRISLPSDWTSTPGSGSLVVAGQPGTVALTASESKGTSGAGGPLGLGSWGYAVLAVILVVVLLLAAFVLLTRRPSPPRARTSDDGTTPGGEPGESDTAPPSG
jgi:Pro-kumamolisin, activation domain/Subtilase family